MHLEKNGQGDLNTLTSEFGEMLPKTGVHHLPDFKVLAFLKILADHMK